MARILAQSPDAVGEVAEVVSSGGLVVIPTDTVYGLACSPSNERAVGRLFEIKSRERSKAIAVLAAGEDQVWQIAQRTPRAEELAMSWPGPITLILARTPTSSEWELGGDGRSIGVRIPDHPFARALMERSGPLAATSANPAGIPTPAVVSSVAEALGDDVDLYVDGGSLEASPSEVISLVEAERVLRGRAGE